MSSGAGTSWDDEAEHYDDSPDHGLRNPAVRAAWRALLQSVLPDAPSDVADLGCGTGSLALLAAEAGHRVTGVDLSLRMIAAARAKVEAAGLPVALQVGDAAAPPIARASVDVVLERHVLWALPDPAAAIRTWVALLRPTGSLVLIEGRWWTGAGLESDDVCRLLDAAGRTVEVVPLPDPALWGGPIEDDRYLVVSRA